MKFAKIEKKQNKIQKSSVGFIVTSHTGLMSLLVL